MLLQTWEVVAPDATGQLHTTTMVESELVESIRLSQPEQGGAEPGGMRGAETGVSVHHFDQLSVLGKGGPLFLSSPRFSVCVCVCFARSL